MSQLYAENIYFDSHFLISVLSSPTFFLHRYLHYYQRYHGHDSALKFAAAQRAQAEARMVEQQEAQKSSWIDVQFLKQAAEQVSGISVLR